MGEDYPDEVRPRSGQVVLGPSGSVSLLPSISCQRALFMAHPNNSGYIWIGNATGTLSGDSGFPLSTNGPGVPLEGLENLNQVLAVPDVDQDRLCWLILDDDPPI